MIATTSSTECHHHFYTVFELRPLMVQKYLHTEGMCAARRVQMDAVARTQRQSSVYLLLNVLESVFLWEVESNVSSSMKCVCKEGKPLEKANIAGCQCTYFVDERRQLFCIYIIAQYLDLE